MTDKQKIQKLKDYFAKSLSEKDICLKLKI